MYQLTRMRNLIRENFSVVHGWCYTEFYGTVLRAVWSVNCWRLIIFTSFCRWFYWWVFIIYILTIPSRSICTSWGYTSTLLSYEQCVKSKLLVVLCAQFVSLLIAQLCEKKKKTSICGWYQSAFYYIALRAVRSERIARRSVLSLLLCIWKGHYLTPLY